MTFSTFFSTAIFTLWFFSSVAQAAVNNIYHQMELRLDPTARELEVNDRIHVEGTGNINFNLAASMVITSIRVDGRKVPQVRHDNILRVDLNDGTDHVIDIHYMGLLSRMTELSGESTPSTLMASPDGSYLGSGSGWHPIIPGIAATYQITLTLPAPQSAIVPGRLIKEETIAGQYRAVFKSEVPSEGIVLIAGPFIIEERHHGGILLRTYFVPSLKDLSADYLDSTADYIDRYTKLIGDYPFSSFSIVSGPLPVGLGFAGMTYIGERVLRLPFIRFTSLGHEVLHNWWGNGVRVDYRNGNWAEGLTTYMADHAFSEERNQDQGKQIRTSWLRDYAALPLRRDHAVRSFISQRHDADQIIGYNKVAFIFHMLKGTIGKENFAKGIHDFWKRYKFAVAGWADVQAVFEQTSGQDLNTFFTQWIDRSGAARLFLSDVTQSVNKISLTLSQPGLPYSLKVPIRLETAKGNEILLASIDGEASRFELPLSARPLAITIDPNFDIFRKLIAGEAPPILRNTTLDTNTTVIIVGTNSRMKSTARELANRMLDGPAHFARNSMITSLQGPLLVIGPEQAVTQFLNQEQLPSTPKTLHGRGTARVWAWSWVNSEGIVNPLLVVEADDNKALQSLLRPLPHYGRRGYLVFNEANVIDDGVWTSTSGPLTVTFD